MNKTLLFTLLIYFNFTVLFSQQQVTVDLSNRFNGFLDVEIGDLKFVQDTTFFYFPAVIPGMYEQNDFGKYIKNFKVTYSDGKTKSIKKNGSNSFLLLNSKKIIRITYQARQTESKKIKDHLFLAAGTFYSRPSALLNFHAIIGYAYEQLNKPMKIAIRNKAGLFGGGALEKIYESERCDTLLAQSYGELIDSPMLYYFFDSKSYSDSLRINNSKIIVHVEPNNHGLTAQRINNVLSPIVSTLENHKFFSSFFKDDYHFILCFTNGYSPYVGALEHNKSSVYVFNGIAGMDDYLKNTLTHELLHVFTPLHLKSNLVDTFNYNNPIFSKHLWLYEGITEYNSLKINLSVGIIDTLEFFKELESKHESQKSILNTSMVDLSKNILSEPFQSQYDLVYSRGALLGFYIDFLLAQSSDGTVGIIDFIEFISQNTDSNGVFDDDILFSTIIKEFPVLEPAVRNYIVGNEIVPFEKCLEELSLQIKRSDVAINKTLFRYGINKFQTKTNKNEIIIKQQPINETLGIKNLRITKIDNKTPNRTNVMLLFGSDKPENLKVYVKGIKEEVVLEPIPSKESYYPYELLIMDRSSFVLSKVLN